MRRSDITILLVEDDPNDRELIGLCFRELRVPANILAVESGSQAIDYFSGRGDFADRMRFPFPRIVITDLKMPNGDGFGVLEYLKQHPESAIIPVLVFTSSSDEDDVKRAYAMGAACYMEKPRTLDAMRECIRSFYDFWSRCLVPEIDVSGNQLQTEYHGKLGERFGPA